MDTRQLILSLHKIGAIKFGTFTLKSGVESPVYFDLRLMVSKPKILAAVADRLQALAEKRGVVFQGLEDDDGIVMECGDAYANDQSFEDIIRGVDSTDRKENEKTNALENNGTVPEEAQNASATSVAVVSQVCGVPYTALPIATRVSINLNLPMIIRRKEAKNYGTKNLLEGKWEAGERCLIVEDVVTSGSSVMETAKVLRDQGLVVEEAVVVLDRQQGGSLMLEKDGIKLHSLFTIEDVLKTLIAYGKISREAVRKTHEFVTKNQFVPESSFPAKKQKLSCVTKMKYLDRIGDSKLTNELFSIMEKKRSNLCVALDVTSAKDVVPMVEMLGPYICVLKMHIDILKLPSIDDLRALTEQLRRLSEVHRFLLFEDRKFADIGQTVKMQYAEGIYEIADWAHIVNAHPLPGPGVVEGLKMMAEERKVGPYDYDDLRGCLLVAEMSSKGNLITKEYSKSALEMAKDHRPFVCGFIAQSRFDDEHPEFVFMTPGVHLESAGDAVGQRYDTPKTAVCDKGADVIIVGRGITKAADVIGAAKEYRNAGWDAYLSRVGDKH